MTIAVVRKAKSEDIAEISSIHIHCFQGNFLSLLGVKGVHYYYQFFIEQPLGICLVAENEKGLAGFVTGWQKGASYQKPLVMQYGAYLIFYLLLAFLKHPRQLLATFPSRLPLLFHLWKLALRGIVFWKKSSTSPVGEWDKNKNASLLSIAVLPDFRGSDAATSLISEFVKNCRERNVPDITLSVHSDNYRARKFYEKNAWVVSNETGALTHYRYPLVENA